MGQIPRSTLSTERISSLVYVKNETLLSWCIHWLAVVTIRLIIRP